MRHPNSYNRMFYLASKSYISKSPRRIRASAVRSNIVHVLCKYIIVLSFILLMPALLLTFASIIKANLSLHSIASIYIFIFIGVTIFGNVILRYSEAKIDAAEVMIEFENTEEREAYVYEALYPRMTGKVHKTMIYSGPRENDQSKYL